MREGQRGRATEGEKERGKREKREGERERRRREGERVRGRKERVWKINSGMEIKDSKYFCENLPRYFHKYGQILFPYIM